MTKVQSKALPRTALWVLLACFVVVRALVPPGFMPNAVSTGFPYALCHGDSRSAVLLNRIAAPASPGAHSGQHAAHQAPLGHALDKASALHVVGHHHDDATAQSFADNHCAFSATASTATTETPLLAFSYLAPIAVANRGLLIAARPPAFLTPPGRAPPSVS